MAGTWIPAICFLGCIFLAVTCDHFADGCTRSKVGVHEAPLS